MINRLFQKPLFFITAGTIATSFTPITIAWIYHYDCRIIFLFTSRSDSASGAVLGYFESEIIKQVAHLMFGVHKWFKVSLSSPCSLMQKAHNLMISQEKASFLTLYVSLLFCTLAIPWSSCLYWNLPCLHLGFSQLANLASLVGYGNFLFVSFNDFEFVYS